MNYPYKIKKAADVNTRFNHATSTNLKTSFLSGALTILHAVPMGAASPSSAHSTLNSCNNLAARTCDSSSATLLPMQARGP